MDTKRTAYEMFLLYSAGTYSDNESVNKITLNAWTDATDAHGRMSEDDADSITQDHVDTFYASIEMQVDVRDPDPAVVAFFKL